MVAKVCLAVLDLCVVSVAMAVAFLVKPAFPGADPRTAVDQHLLVAVGSLPIWLAVFSHHRLYSARHVTSRLDELRRVAHASVVGGLGIAVLGFLTQLYVARGWLLASVVLVAVLMVAERELVRSAFAWMRRRGRFLRPVVIIGDNVEALALSDMAEQAPNLGYRVVGFLSNDLELGSSFCHKPVLGRVGDAFSALERSGATGVVIATTSVDVEGSNALVRELTEAGYHVELSSSLEDIASERITVRPLGRYPMMYVEPVQRGGWRAMAKRAFDVVFSAVALVLTAPLLALVAVLIKLESPGPVLFRQTRVGHRGARFDIVKLRTMTHDAEDQLVDLLADNEADGPLFKVRHDPRVTRVGGVLRALSIDEIPQFWNVLRGDMSIVGPRPALPREVEQWNGAVSNRLRVKPGITGMWQVSGRCDTNFDDYCRLDLYYVDNWSLWTDMAIVAKTVPTVMLRKGAY